MLKDILAISGRPGLYKLITQSKNMWIVESLNPQKRRFPVPAHQKVSSLADIAIYTDEGDVPLYDVLNAIKDKEKGQKTILNTKRATGEQFRAYLAEVLPNFDRDKVYVSDIKKMLNWYNTLLANGITTFKEVEEETIEEEK
ncbi:MAG: DUF5606 domain-containing protein [Bacteroides sp.]|nr:DUF5606 domain-containing protein [Bacteroides sp.]MDD2646012.1 DUF5606 domain-containing protein [Bacteroides sp.]MDD4055945.1 DUF5606 domain-containing protein [Bacteroides sp.]MDD4720374.1 DUF5606 domain-containing protein [Bacteroides sp.]NLI63989.1 DUF5606 domain-containing protein [Bacteroidales bacterium]